MTLTGREVLERATAVHSCHQHLHNICSGLPKVAASQHNTLSSFHWALIRTDSRDLWYTSFILSTETSAVVGNGHTTSHMHSQRRTGCQPGCSLCWAFWQDPPPPSLPLVSWCQTGRCVEHSHLHSVHLLMVSHTWSAFVCWVGSRRESGGEGQMVHGRSRSVHLHVNQWLSDGGW